MNTITIAIVNWNTGELLAQCLQSLLALPSGERNLIRSIVVVDNASSDTSLDQARIAVGADTSVNFIQLPTNTGFAQGNNVVLSHYSNGSHVLLLNPDTRVLPGAIQALLQVLEEDSRAGIVGPKLLNADSSVQPSVRAFPSWSVLLFFLLKLNHFFPEAKVWRNYLQQDFTYNQRQDVDQIMGAAFLIRAETLRDVGLFDEDFWLWFEEVDYCRRAKEKGWKVVYTPAGRIVHVGGVSFGQWRSVKRYFQFIRSAARYARKHLL